jgi:cell wall-associated NlpC family hydrolase
MPPFLLAAILAAGTVNRPVQNMYSSPTEDSDVVSQAIYGSNVKIEKEAKDWVEVRTADDYKGWIPANSLVRNGKAYATSGRVAMVANLFSNLYREASVTKHAPVMTVPFETKVEIVEETEARWVRVRLVDDRAGWIQKGDLTFDLSNLSIDRTIELSKKFMGLPYTWGGTSSFGYDCSGFTQMLCRRRGITMPRDAGPQANWSGVASIDKKDLQKGDLLFFGPSAAKITHTGMYIGNGEFIHATTNQQPIIQISKLADPHWTNLLVATRRPK